MCKAVDISVSTEYRLNHKQDGGCGFENECGVVELWIFQSCYFSPFENVRYL